jgi:hypothetical protein
MLGRTIRILVVVLAVVGIIVGGYFLWDRMSRVSTGDLERIVQRDAVPADELPLPDEVLDRLAANRVLLVGEFHFLREHRELIADLLRELHQRGYRQYLFEWTQAVDWMLYDYVNDGDLVPWWTPPHDIGGEAITAIREFNQSLPESERIQVHAIDVQLEDYGGMQTWVGILELLSGFLPEQGPIAVFLDGDHETYDSHRALLEELQEALKAERSELIASWGAYWFDTVVEMVEVELRGVTVRAIRDSDYDESVRLREDDIKWLADRRIDSNPNGTLINFGNTHTQKEGLWGTEDIEWLGDYLVHSSEIANGSAFALWVAPARIVPVPGSKDPEFDLSASPSNELLRIVSETNGDKIVFLPMDDPLFSD